MAPEGGVDEDGAVVVEKQRVDQLAGSDAVEGARLQSLEGGTPREFEEAHEGEVEQADRPAGREMLFDRVHSARTSMKLPTAMHKAAAKRRSTVALTAWARRTPAATPASSNTATQAARPKSMRPSWKLAAEP